MPGLIVALLALLPVQVVVPDVVLQDQFELPRDVKHHRGDIVVLIYGDRKSADTNKTLGEQIHVAFHPTAKGLPPKEARKTPVKPLADVPAGTRHPEVLALPVACIGKVPQLVRKVLRGQFKSGSPDVSVWLDFNDVMKTQFPFQPGVPNVVVLDAQGRYRYAAGGTPTVEGMTKLLGVIEALRREAVRSRLGGHDDGACALPSPTPLAEKEANASTVRAAGQARSRRSDESEPPGDRQG